jgi:hypothetical protein
VGYDLPPFDPVASHDRIVKRLEAAKTYDELTKAWGEEQPTVLQIGEVRKDLGRACYETRDRMKAALQPKEAA